MDIEKLKANKPEGTDYFNSFNIWNPYYRTHGEVVQYYSNCYKKWINSGHYTTAGLLSATFIDLRETAPVWTPENNTLPFGELTREQKLAQMAAWIDGGLAFSLVDDCAFALYKNPRWTDDCIYQVRKPPSTAFIEQCKKPNSSRNLRRYCIGRANC